MVTQTLRQKFQKEGRWLTSMLACVPPMALVALLWCTHTALAVELQLFTLKNRSHSSTTSPLIERMEAQYGKLNTPIQARGYAFEYELLTRTPKGRGIGFGLEFFQENTNLKFGDNGADSHQMGIIHRGILFSMKAFLRYSTWLPFFALGVGNYYVEIREREVFSVSAFSVENVWHTKLGLRWVPGRVAWVVEIGWVNADLLIPTSVGTHPFVAGGATQSVGVSWAF